MTALERVKQELGWWIEGNEIVGPKVSRKDVVIVAGRYARTAFALALRLAEENERLTRALSEVCSILPDANLVESLKRVNAGMVHTSLAIPAEKITQWNSLLAKLGADNQ